MAEPVITVVVVDYRKGARVVANVRSLHRQYRADRLEIVVIDNSVDPANAALLEPLGSLPGVRLVVNPRNVGYTAACNQGAAMGAGELLLLLNPDIFWAEEGALRRLAAFMREHPRVAVAGPRQVNEDGSFPRTARRFPNVMAQLARRSALGRLPLFAGAVGSYEASDLDYGRTQPVDWLQSSCVLVRRDFWDRVGGLDERYFLFMADCVLCWEAWDRGTEVFHVAEATVVADGIRASAGGVRALFRNPAVRHHLRDAMLYHARYLGRSPSGRRPGDSLAVAALKDAERGSGEVADEAAPAP